MLSEELIRVAVLWHEIWHEGLEEASRLYFGDHNPQAMFAIINNLYDCLEKVCFRWVFEESYASTKYLTKRNWISGCYYYMRVRE